MNRIFYALVAIAFVYAAIAHITWRPPEAEAHMSAVSLSSGQVLVVGPTGTAMWNGKGYKLASWTDEDAPATARRGADLAALPDGGALLIGGEGQTAGLWSWFSQRVGMDRWEVTQDVELRDPQTGKWRSVNPVPAWEPGGALGAMKDGSPVIIAGAKAFRYVVDYEGWEALPSPPEARTGAVLSTLPDGDLLLIGGEGADGVAKDALRWDVDSRMWSRVPGPTFGRLYHRAVALPHGDILVVGGEVPGMGPVKTTQSFDPDTNTWTSAGQLPLPRPGASSSGRLDPAVVALPDGRVLAVGGVDGTGERLQSAAIRGLDGKWVEAAGFDGARVSGIGLMAGGSAVVVGGERKGGLVYRGDVDAWIPSEPPSPMGRVGDAMLKRAETAVMKIVLPLIGGMTLFLGAMKVAEAGGLMTVLARLIRPVMVRLFPEVPPDHPAMGAMILNMAANALGLGNAATPFGIRAMEQLDSLNSYKGTATNAMVLFLAINTSNVTILPTGVIVLRAINGSTDPGGILVTTLFATICSTTVAVIATKFYQRIGASVKQAHRADDDEVVVPDVPAEAPSNTDEGLPESASEAYPWWVSALVIGGLLSIVPLAVLPTTRPWIEAGIPWIIPALIAGLLTYGFFKGVPVYETFVSGAKDGWNVAVKIIPFVVGILVVIAMLKSSGAMEAFTGLIGGWTSYVGLPAEALPMALLRPLSGSGAMGVMIDTISDPAVGPDSYTGYLVSTFQGSTETTFYVIAVYYGAVGIKRLRHSLASALTADLAGVIGAIIICSLMYGVS
ncbi:MAG: nucleoside recognition domain-containing protein [Myxococcota bacterium]